MWTQHTTGTTSAADLRPAGATAGAHDNDRAGSACTSEQRCQRHAGRWHAGVHDWRWGLTLFDAGVDDNDQQDLRYEELHRAACRACDAVTTDTHLKPSDEPI